MRPGLPISTETCNVYSKRKEALFSRKVLFCPDQDGQVSYQSHPGIVPVSGDFPAPDRHFYPVKFSRVKQFPYRGYYRGSVCSEQTEKKFNDDNEVKIEKYRIPPDRIAGSIRPDHKKYCPTRQTTKREYIQTKCRGNGFKNNFFTAINLLTSVRIF